MDAVSYAISQIHLSIPRQVLEAGFLSDPVIQKTDISLDARIKHSIIDQYVMVDCNLVGGVEIVIPLNNLNPVLAENYQYVYQIPPDYTDGRQIVSVLSVSAGYLFPYTAGTLYNSGNALGVANRIMDTVTPHGNIFESNVELIGPNTVLVKHVAPPNRELMMRCIVENSPNMANISTRSYPAFAKLCVYLTQAYLYNKLVISMGQTYLYGGYDLGVIKDIVSEYRDSLEQYQTYLREVWTKVAMMNDQERYHRYLKLMINPGV